MSPLFKCRWGGLVDPVDNVRAFHLAGHSVLSTVRTSAVAAGSCVRYGQSPAFSVGTTWGQRSGTRVSHCRILRREPELPPNYLFSRSGGGGQGRPEPASAASEPLRAAVAKAICTPGRSLSIDSTFNNRLLRKPREILALTETLTAALVRCRLECAWALRAWRPAGSSPPPPARQ